uniref:Uncharacterized protein n=1 Tax=Nymphaea colorata TaxID=210225 RepID=A0A5K1GIV3_9MAGN
MVLLSAADAQHLPPPNSSLEPEASRL